MQIIRSLSHMQTLADSLREDGKRIGFVPTMGALHEGHLSLCRTASQHADVTVMSIYVNPTQFGPSEDLDRYPRDFAGDERKAAAAGVDILFYPEESKMYSRRHSTWITVEGISEGLCGASRPGHFKGVTTIVAKLLNLVKPHVLIMGQKDAQQAAVIMRMLGDLNIGTELVVSPTVRESDGLAMSSRNVYLNAESRKDALKLSGGLKLAEKMLKEGVKNVDTILERVKRHITSTDRIRLEYLEFRTWPDLEPVREPVGKILLAGAIVLADVRLIDNIIVGQE